jgi:hypothetical protein
MSNRRAPRDLCRSCGSCGFPMSSPADFAGGNTSAEYCSTCADIQGILRPWDEVLQANAAYYVRQQGVDPAAAREMARALLLSMPAWAPRR